MTRRTSQRVSPSPAPPPIVGNAEVAARYDVREELGRGGVAVVYRAIDRVTREEVALKVSRQFEDPGQAREADRFLEREYHALAQLSHPNVVKRSTTT